MPKQLNVNLAFSADTSKAKAQLQDLQKQLDTLTQHNSTVSNNFGISKELQNSIYLTSQLKTQLQDATNINTGKLDLTKFSDSLKKSGTNLQQYRDALQDMGPAGDKAFASLATSIQNADIPLKRVNSGLAEMKTVLANTVKWQISSSLLHGFMGAISTANRYAQDLNESLNNIRIVTGYNVDEMARFAEQANRAAKSLSTTTTEYTNASLIYYQQGLSDAEVQQRTDVTIKMANVARQSATVVSDQLTAIWNNFYDGSKSLEYYADVMTALGAVTASSTDEIAGGLEKFAAIGETIGLSYEYAASALATITSNTRQSEEVVGTALKTIFARIQGLNLGETLDDGTTLNKYSEALDTVGISIFESNGELKEMDNILDELGAKWDTIGKAEQTALAQTVAGVRQYTQLIALMENWDNGDNDSMQANLQTSYNASGALDQQADIYAESWEAARDRVTAATESIYSTLIDDEFFIDLLNGFEKIITSVDHTIDALGGLPGALSLIGTLGLQIFGKDLANGIDNVIFRFKTLTGVAQKEAAALRQQSLDLITSMSMDMDTNAGRAQATTYKAQADAQKALLDNVNRMSDTEKQVLQTMMDINKAQGESAIKAGEAADAAIKQSEATERSLRTNNELNATFSSQKSIKEMAKTTGAEPNLSNFNLSMQYAGEFEAMGETLSKSLASITKNAGKEGSLSGKIYANNFTKALETLKNQQISLGNKDDLAKIKNIQTEIATIQDKLKVNADGTFDISIEEAKELQRLYQELQQIAAQTGDNLIGAAQDGQSDKNAEAIRRFGEQARETGVKVNNCNQQVNGLEAGFKRIGEAAGQSSGKIYTFGEKMSTLAQATTSVISIYNAVKGIWDTIENPDLTDWEKAIAILGSIAMTLPMAISSFSRLGEVFKLIGPASASAAAGTTAVGAASGAATPAATGFSLAVNSAIWPITAVVAALGLLCVGLYAAVRAYNADARAAEKAIKTAEDLVDANTKVKESYDKLKQSFNTYESAQKALDDLVEGTVEWKEQLQQVHNNVLNLIEAYPNLLKYANAIQYDEKTGLIKGVNEQYLQEIMNDAANDAAETDAAAKMGTIIADQAQLKSNITDAARAISGYTSGARKITDGNSKIVDVDLKSFIAENAIELFNLDDNAYKKRVTEILESTLTNQGYDVENFRNDFDVLINSLVEDRELINQIGKEALNIKQQLDNTSKIIVSQEIADDLQKIEKQDREAVSKMSQEIYEATAERNLDTYLTALKDNTSRTDNYNTLDPDTQKIINKFQEMYNLTNLDQNSDNFITGAPENRYYHWNTDQFDGGGKVSAEFIAQTVAAADALADCGVNAKKAANALSYMDKKFFDIDAENAQGMGEGVRGFLEEGNFERLNMDEFEAFKKEFGDSFDEEELRSLFPNWEDQEIADAFGVESIEAAVDKWNDELYNIPDALNNVSKILTKTPEIFFKAVEDKGLFKQMSVETKTNMANMFQQVFNEGGREGLTTLSEFIESLGADADIFANSLESIDWNTASPQSLINDLQELGISIDDDAAPQLKVLIDLMKQVAAIDLKTAQEEYARYQNWANSLKAGDTVSDKDYNQIIKDNPELAQYFKANAAGGYYLTDTTGNFQEALENQSYEKYTDYLNQIPELINKYALGASYFYEDLQGSAIKEYGWTRGQQEEKAQGQLDYLVASDYEDAEKLAQWQDNLDHGTMTIQDYEDLATAIEQCGDNTEYFEERVSSLNDDLEQAQEAIDFSNYVDQVNDLGLEFEFTESYAKALEEQMRASGEQYDNLEQAARNLAIANQRLDRGLKGLSDNLDSYQSQLKDSSQGTVEYQRTMEGLKDNLADIFNTDKKFISNKFVEEQLLGDPKKLKEVANGNMKIINSMRKDLAKSAVIELETRVDSKNLENFKKAFVAFEASFPDLEVGAFIHEGDEVRFINSLNQMIAAAQLTHDEVNALLGSMGMSAKITTINQAVQTPAVETIEEWKYEETQPATFDDAGTMLSPPGGIRRKNVSFKPTTITTYQQVPVIETIAADGTNSGGGIDFLQKNNSAPGLAPSTSGGGSSKGGGGGSSEPAEPIKLTKHSDIVDRYKEVDDTLDNVRDAFEDVEKITDRLYGVSHISGLKYQNKLLQQEIGLLKDKVKEAKAYLAVDKQELANAAAKAGVSVQLGIEGDITNYTSSMNKLFDELHAAEVYWNNTYQGKTQEDQQKYQEEVLDPIKEKIDDYKDAVAQYDETKELIEDLQNEIDDKFYQWQDNNYEILHYTLEIELELNELELKEIDYYLKKLEDDFYSLAEAAGYMNDQIPVWLRSLEEYEKFYKGMDGTVDLKEVAQLAFVDGTKEGIEGILETLTELNELDKEMKEYYGKTLEMANEELEIHIKHMDHLNAVMEHYQNIIELVNGEYDYNRIGTVLEGYASTLNSELQVLKANYQMLLSEKEAIQKSYDTALDDAEREIFREELEKVTTALDEAQEAMLTKTEEWAEAMKSVLENTIAAAGKVLEDAFTFNMGFDAVSNSLDRLSSFQEEYLTKTNQVYETQKMMREAQQAADKTENEASKVKLKAFIDETKQLQNKNQMSQLDLEIQKAKYDLLLAQIALEDAQNAKSTVRLQRDNEGNFGYVYTADQNQISEKEQELADAENNLYNIGLEAANDYGQKRLELQQQLADELISLNERRNNGEFATDALYYAERDRIINEYNNLFTAYSDQYTTALGVNAEIQRDSWIQAYDEMINQTANWKDRTTEYLGTCEEAYSHWREVVTSEGEIINDVLTNTSNNVKDLTTESKELSEQLKNELIPTINNELIAVRNITSAYAALRDMLIELIEYYERLAYEMRKKVEEEARTDRFEYSREVMDVETIGGGSVFENVSAEAIQQAKDPNREKTGVGSIFNSETGLYEIMDEDARYEEYMRRWRKMRLDSGVGYSYEDEKKAMDTARAAAIATEFSADSDLAKKMGFETVEDFNMAQTLQNKNSQEYAMWLSQAMNSSISKAMEEAATNGRLSYDAFFKYRENGGDKTYTEWLQAEQEAIRTEATKQYNDMIAAQQKQQSDYWDNYQENNGGKPETPKSDLEVKQDAFDDAYDNAKEQGKSDHEATMEAVVAGNKADAHNKNSERNQKAQVKEDLKKADQQAQITGLMNASGMTYAQAKAALGFSQGGLADFTGPAMIHGSKARPELVLNPDDTKNFLAATDILRTISQTIDLQAMSSQVNLNTPPELFNEYDRALEQMVHIEASFPAVQDRNEIEAAFDNLINTAAQYANRKY